ncbi:MAG: acyl--CoA ligase [Planctomycetes bacterium]|nr:acyl--CoA ligase [Planctomycetota bacterium]
MLISQVLKQSRQRWPEKVALWFGGRPWTFTELDDTSDRIAGALAAKGIKAGDRVAIFLPNCSELVLTYFACFKLGAIAVPLNYRYRQPEAEYAIEHSGSVALIVHQSLVAEVGALPLEKLGVRLRYLVAGKPGESPSFRPFDELIAAEMRPVPAVDFAEPQLAAILYTSGTTARPKGVMYSHGSLYRNCEIQTESFEYGPEDVILISTAACHAAAFTGQLLPGVFAGSTCVLTFLPKPAEVVEAIEQYGVTRVQMLPATLEDLVEHLETLPDVSLAPWRCCTAGGDVVPLDLQRRFQKRVGFEITELYGMTELLSCISNPPFGAKRLGSIGKPVVRTSLRIVDDKDAELPRNTVGELLVKNDAMMVGYWRNEEATSAALRDGWMHTGDVSKVDDEGFCWFVGRKKELIIRGGSNISPLEVEEVLDEHPAVHLSCVVGAPDKHFGEIVTAYVSLRQGLQAAPSPEELRTFVAERIAAYKVPEKITVLDELPLNATGKVDRKKLHAQIAADLAN